MTFQLSTQLGTLVRDSSHRRRCCVNSFYDLEEPETLAPFFILEALLETSYPLAGHLVDMENYVK